MSTTQIIEKLADLTFDNVDDQRKADYVLGQYLAADRTDSDLAMLAGAVEPMVRGR